MNLSLGWLGADLREVCGPAFAVAFGLLQGVVVQFWGVAPNHPNQPKTCATTSLKQPKSYCRNEPCNSRETAPSQPKPTQSQP